MKNSNPAKYPRRIQKCSGFSLIELMVVIAILGTLASLAAPSFSESIKRYRIASVRDDLIGSIQFARSEAIRRGVAVSLKRTTTASCAPATADEWDCGWEIFVDRNANGTRNANANPSLDDTLIQKSVVPAGYGVMHKDLGSSLTINVWGQAKGMGQNFVLTPPEGVSGASTTTVCINSGGRIRKLEGEASCT